MKKTIFKTLMIALVLFTTRLSAVTVYGTLTGGVPVVSISFSALNTNINSAAVANGFTSGSLTSYEIVNESLYGYSFRYTYQFLDATGTILYLKTGIPLVLTSSNDFIEDVAIVSGGRQIVTCKRTNCEGCELVKDDCTPPCTPKADPPFPVCEKTTTTSSGATTPAWISAIVGVLAFLRGLL